MADQQSPMEFDADKVPEVLPILPLYDAALFPKMVLPLVVMQGESVKLWMKRWPKIVLSV